MYICIIELTNSIMIRIITQSDLLVIQSIVSFPLGDIDISNSAINFDDNGNIKAVVLTKEEKLINTFPRNHFPKTKQTRSGAFDSYTKENNHKIVFLYKADRNGDAISATFYYLINKYLPRGEHWWWLDKNAPSILDDEFNKIKVLLCPIEKTDIYYKY